MLNNLGFNGHMFNIGRILSITDRNENALVFQLDETSKCQILVVNLDIFKFCLGIMVYIRLAIHWSACILNLIVDFTN